MSVNKRITFPTAGYVSKKTHRDNHTAASLETTSRVESDESCQFMNAKCMLTSSTQSDPKEGPSLRTLAVP